MSLPPAAARAAEARWRVPVFEIYGSTETGALATRRAATDDPWTPLPDVTLRPAEGTILAQGDRIGNADPSRRPDGVSAQTAASAGAAASQTWSRFAGKRRLARRARAAPAGGRGSVDDGTFFIPEGSGEEVRRLAGF